LKVPTADGYFLEFEVDGFSEFYVSTQNLGGPETPLPVEIISFTARNSGSKGDVLIEWNTASEINLDRFEVSASCDGRNFEPITKTPSLGSKNEGKRYQFLHTGNSCNSSNTVYRLQAFDIGKSTSSAELRAIVKNTLAGSNQLRMVNPAENQLHIEGLTGETTRIQLSDALGRICIEKETEDTEFNENIEHLPAGMYSLRVLADGNPQTFKIIIR